MLFEDLFNPAEEIHNLKVQIEQLEQDLKDHKGLSNVILKQRQELVYLLKESGFYLKAFETAMTENDFKKCTTEGKKKYEEWLKKEFELSTPEVTATIQP